MHPVIVKFVILYSHKIRLGCLVSIQKKLLPLGISLDSFGFKIKCYEL